MSISKGIALIAAIALVSCQREKPPAYSVKRLFTGRTIKFVKTSIDRGYFEVVIFQPLKDRPMEEQEQCDNEIWTEFAHQADAGGWTFGELVTLDNLTYSTFPKESLSSTGIIQHVKFNKNQQGQWVRSDQYVSGGNFD